MNPLARPRHRQFLLQKASSFCPCCVDRPRLGARLAVEVGHQRRHGSSPPITARIDIAVACAMLQRNAPLPSRVARSRARVGGQNRRAFARHRHGAIARQPVRPALEAGLQRLLDQKAAEAGTIDEEIPPPRSARRAGRSMKPPGAAERIHDPPPSSMCRTPRAPDSHANISRRAKRRNDRRSCRSRTRCRRRPAACRIGSRGSRHRPANNRRDRDFLLLPVA